MTTPNDEVVTIYPMDSIIPQVGDYVEVEFKVKENKQWFLGIVRHVSSKKHEAYVDFRDGKDSGWYPYETEMRMVTLRGRPPKIINTYDPDEMKDIEDEPQDNTVIVRDKNKVILSTSLQMKGTSQH